MGKLPPVAAPGVPAGGGRPLDSRDRTYFEPRFGVDLSPVRIHVGARAARSAESVGAAAFTTGRDIVWGARAPGHDTGAGRSLLAHELAHAVGQGVREPLRVARQCLPSPLCPLASIPLPATGFRWESAEVCLQRQYPFKGVVGSNKDWRFLTPPPGSVEERDHTCFKSHLVAKSGMFLAQPDIIDFTRAEIYDVTTWGQAYPHRVRLWADTGEATALAAIPDCSGTGRLWKPGTWIPAPCYHLQGDIYMQVVNSGGLLLYTILKDVTKELAAAALLAAIIAAGKNQLKKGLGTRLATKVPHVAAAYAAVTILVVLTTDAELAFGAEGDPIENLIKAIENSGELLPDEIKEAMRSDPDLRAKIEAAAKEKNPSKRAKQLSKACLQVIAKNKDKFSREDLEALTTMVQMTADDKLPDKAPTVEALKKQAEQIRSGKKPDPAAGTSTGGKDASKAGEGKTTADLEKEVAAGQPGLRPDTIQKVAAAPELTRGLLDRIAAKTGAGNPLSDADVERLLGAVPADLTQAQFDQLVAKLDAGTAQKPAELLANLEKQLAAVRKASQAATAADLEKQHPELSAEAREKLAKASPAARSLIEAVAGVQGVALTDQTVDRFLKIFNDAVTLEQVEAIVGRLGEAKPEDSINSVLDKLEKAVKIHAKAATPGQGGGGGKAKGPDAVGGEGKGKGTGGGQKGKASVKLPAEGVRLARLLVTLAGKVGPSQNRLEYDGKRPVSGSVKTGCRFFGKLQDGTAYIAEVSVRFTKVKDPEARYVITRATNLYDLNATRIIPEKPLVGLSVGMTLDPPTSPAK